MHRIAAQLICALVLFSSASLAIPEKVYLPVPFLCQAPFGNWSEPWQDACEEAAIIMAMSHIKGDRVTRGSGDQDILKLVDYQTQYYGGHFDLTAEQAVKLVKEYYHFSDIEIKYEFTVSDIKDELAKKNIVIAPMAGRMLGNPYFTPPGPAYHYLLFKGYDDSTGEFITNDAGTKRGRNYHYDYDTAYNAIHEWTGSKSTIRTGRKAIIIFKTS